MAAPYKKLSIRKIAKNVDNGTEESRYWNRFKRKTFKEIASVTSIHFSPIAPHDFAVTSSTRVQIYSPKNKYQVTKSISRFHDIAYSGNIRNDGNLLVAGDATGLIQIFNIHNRAILRTMEGHKLPVQVTKFAPGNTQVLSCSDDKTVRIWDIPGQEPVSVLEGHQLIKYFKLKDYVRSGLINNGNPHLVLSGSYDQTVKLWDMRTNTCAMTLMHEAPVEEVLFLDDQTVISAGGPTIKVWDINGGGRVTYSLSNHQKTVTSMCFNSLHSRLLTGSLDRQVKVYDTKNFEVLHGLTYPGPILSLAISPDETHFAVGMTSGTLAVQFVKVEKVSKREKEQPKPGTYQYFIRGFNHSGSKDDHVIEAKRKEKLAMYDQYLRNFQYSNALDAVLRPTTLPILTVSLIQELILRDALTIAIAGRDETSLTPLIKFVTKWITDPKYMNLMVDVAQVILELYSPVIGQSSTITNLIKTLHQKVKGEISIQLEMAKVIGSVEMIFAGGALRNKKQR
ncbi:19780_t:CDS:10 [Funneliformis geosporum]|uniref:4758_t:CDS:1 n=1 Tax=Funneliformis geosporum TaxID=1117311 RepID=A0A9W4WR13_9GLOM|nr:19780_t:CDS:10 [Funneliformis geosporum]CAI2179902.1 4758_t:CDS:10 [Funneliformis geosporum]